MTLSAWDAAARLAGARGRSMRTRGTWRPLTLRWRRRRAPVAQARARAVGTTVQATWLSQLHLHFAPRGPERVPGAGWRARQPDAPVGSPKQVFVERHALATRTSPHAMPSPRAAPGSAGVRPVAVFARPGGRVGTTEARIAANREPSARGVEMEGRGALRRRALLAHRRGVPRDVSDDSALPRARGPLAHNDRPTPPLQTRASMRTAASPVADAPASPTRLARRLELVWRAAPRAPSHRADDDGTRRAASAPERREAIEMAEAQAITPRAEIESATRVATMVTQLAPELVDRLADDVIRRVERRVRIDRERRGL